MCVNHLLNMQSDNSVAWSKIHVNILDGYCGDMKTELLNHKLSTKNNFNAARLNRFPLQEFTWRIFIGEQH